jgi:hypothetical protein
MSFNFQQITGPENSKRRNFLRLCKELILQSFPGIKLLEVAMDDEEIYLFIGLADGINRAFQCLYVLEGISTTKRLRLEEVLTEIISIHGVQRWLLIIPKDVDSSEATWLEQIREKYGLHETNCWGASKLRELIAQIPAMMREFQPQILVGEDFIGVAHSGSEIPLNMSETLGFESPPRDILLSAVEDIRNRARIRVLILGPGPGGGDIYVKRGQIRERIQRLGHDADFCEDVWSSDTLAASGLNLAVAEFIQAMGYDYIVCLMTSPGSIGEFHDFATHRKLACMMMTCIDRAHKEGYSAQGVVRIYEGLNGKLFWFDYPADIDGCNVATHILDQVQKVAEKKQWFLSTGIS